jgi:hypothetical protein
MTSASKVYADATALIGLRRAITHAGGNVGLILPGNGNALLVGHR